MSAEIKHIKEAFNISVRGLQKIFRDFHIEMLRGLAGQKSSLKMIPTYADKPTGKEKGKFLALDLGGTNFRILQVKLNGQGRAFVLRENKFTLSQKHIHGTGKELFSFIAECLKEFMQEVGVRKEERRSLGFTFSFPVCQTGVASGRLIHWTKDFSASSVVGRDVVELLRKAILRKGIKNISIAALVNDTVGTLAAKAYEEKKCTMAVILGTGTNACYREKLTNIKKWPGRKTKDAQMIINIEWGNFNKLPLTNYDKLLDASSDNPGEQILEKMVSGMYLNQIAGIILEDLKLFHLSIAKKIKTEHISGIEGDTSIDLKRVKIILNEIGISQSSLEERKKIKSICQIVTKRGARISAAAIAAVITRIDPQLSSQHIIAVDGSLYQKHPQFAQNIQAALKEIFAKKARRIKLILTKDGSGIGAAIIASSVATKEEKACSN